MKTIFSLFMLCCSAIYAQDESFRVMPEWTTAKLEVEIENKLLALHDFTYADGRALVTAVPCQISDRGATHTFAVSLVCQQNIFQEIGLDKINNIIVQAYHKGQATLPFDHQYLPTEIKMAYNPLVKDWSLTNAYCTKDQSGNVSSKLLSIDFNALGDFLVMKRIF